MAVLTLATTTWQMVVAAVLYAATFGTLMPTITPLVVDRAPEHARATALGINTAFFDLGIGFGSAALGVVVSYGGYASTYLAAGVIVAAGAVGFAIWEKRLRLPNGNRAQGAGAGRVSMPQVRAHVRVFGDVQGVYFRGTARGLAHANGISGWIRNRADGSVEAMFEGEEEAVRDMVAWCHQGPLRAQVESVDLEWLPATGEFKGFAVT